MEEKPLVERITDAIKNNDTVTGRIPMGGPYQKQAQEYIERLRKQRENGNANGPDQRSH